MRFTQQTFLEYYLNDLCSGPDPEHNRTVKVRYINVWKSFIPHCTTTPSRLTRETLETAFVWSDQHLYHKNIILYENRPFTDKDQMTEALLDNCRKVVSPQNILLFGGDIGFAPRNKINADLVTLSGYKIHIIGNHDVDRSNKLHLFDVDERHLCLVVDVCDTLQILFTHYPLTVVPDGCVNFHGHIHGNPAPSPRHFNMCVEHLDFKPAHLSNILANFIL